ncbi:hypothetical protein ONZ45_g11477 [Pleurotus djamor]|nr:hypothetical protein ONZ45_g14381 [Pleurotus djamor]KAJ8502743.1 hypothetical protein ONZ45_g11477 [Pleurotus djamor]
MSVDEYGYTEEERFNIEIRGLIADYPDGIDDGESNVGEGPYQWPLVEGDPTPILPPSNPPSSPCSFRFHNWDEQGGGGQAAGYLTHIRKEESKERSRIYRKQMLIASRDAAQLGFWFLRRQKDIRKLQQLKKAIKVEEDGYSVKIQVEDA